MSTYARFARIPDYTQYGKFLTSGGERKSPGEKSGKESNARIQGPGYHYICPFGCEGDKLYSNAGICPVCQVNLFPMGEGYLFY